MNESDETRNHAQHPEELLAAYVSGEASEGDRTTVQALLSACSECRREVDLAVQARAALQSLPELESPALRVDRVAQPTAAATRERTPVARPGILEKLREWGWERIAWGAGLVAAGALVALFVLVQAGGGPSEEQAAQAPRPTTTTFLENSGAGRGYTPASLDALARRLVASERTALAAGQTAPKADVTDRAGDCLRRGGGLPSRARPVHAEEAAFRGTPAFVGAFETGAAGGRQYLLVLAVDHSTCDALYVITRSL
jgi:anti-sigma factor RsiW